MKLPIVLVGKTYGVYVFETKTLNRKFIYIDIIRSFDSFSLVIGSKFCNFVVNFWRFKFKITYI
jgi:hypothetical protein